MLKPMMLAVAAAVAISAAGGTLAAETAKIPSYIAAAVNNPDRPAADKAVDGTRKPAEMLTWAGVKPGDKVIELMPGRGYYTRMLAKVVGDDGHLYELLGPAPANGGMSMMGGGAIQKIASNDDNVTLNNDPYTSFSIPEPADLFWTSLNYHDLHIRGTDMAAFNQAVFDSLKPGGIYIVIDHAANPGITPALMRKVHRIDESVVKKEVEAAGFKLIAESKALRDPKDDRTKPIFGKHYHTDRFALKFEKPGT